MKNIHISLTEFRNESRVLKETASLVNTELFKNIIIIALGADGLASEEKIDSKRKLLRINLYSRKLPKSLPFQVLKYLEFLIRTLFIIRHEKPAVVNIHTVGLLFLGSLSRLINKHKLIYDAHELETEVTGGNSFRKKLSKWVELKFIKHVDMTIVVSESIADWYANEYQIQRPPVVLNAPNRRELKANNHFREKLGIRDDQVILLYQGGLMAGRGVHLILDAFKVRNDDQLVAVFMGYGQLEADIKAAAEQHENIYFFPAVAPQVVLEYTSSADVGISLIENTCLSYYYCMPNKLFEYAMAGLPVLVSNMKDMSELVTQNAMGAVISDFTPAGINQALDEFLQKDLTQMKANAYRVATENAWEEQEKKMVSAYEELLNQGDL